MIAVVYLLLVLTLPGQPINVVLVPKPNLATCERDAFNFEIGPLRDRMLVPEPNETRSAFCIEVPALGRDA